VGKFQFLKNVIPSGYAIDDVVTINGEGQILADGALQATANTASYLLLLTPVTPVLGMRP
jgi:hypothetical protein